jgi:phage shock protein B
MDLLIPYSFAYISGNLIPIVMFICGTLIAITAILKGKSPPRDNEETKEEAETIQELYKQCNRLADRIEALETIILEQERNRKSDPS